MALTTDRVRPSELPNSWRIGRITGASAILASVFLVFCVVVLAVGKFKLGFGIESLRTLSVVAIVYGSQATIYAIRGHRHFWAQRPTIWLAIASLLDLLIISTLATRGIAMSPLPVKIVACEFAAAVVLFLVLDVVKIPVFTRLEL
jgi:H+-transporting ATPase